MRKWDGTHLLLSLADWGWGKLQDCSCPSPAADCGQGLHRVGSLFLLLRHLSTAGLSSPAEGSSFMEGLTGRGVVTSVCNSVFPASAPGLQGTLRGQAGSRSTWKTSGSPTDTSILSPIQPSAQLIPVAGSLGPVEETW